jgi:2-polyprenyl-3-methyl-5-hydroxy-6-metoxy-1,4-benzoquinol methylase
MKPSDKNLFYRCSQYGLFFCDLHEVKNIKTPFFKSEMQVMNKNIYRDSCSYSSAQDRMSYIPNYYSWIFKKFSKYLYGSIIDVGCGAGHIVSQYLLHEQIKHITLVDKDRDCLVALKNKYETRSTINKLYIINSDIIEFLSNHKKASAKNIIMLDVLEHIEDDYALVKLAHKALRQRGKLIIKVPAGSSIYCNIDVQSGHYRRYDFHQLHRLMEDSGFNVLNLSYMNPIGRLAYSIKSKKKQNTNFSKSYSIRFLKLINIAIMILPFIDVLKIRGLSLIGIFEKH